MSLCRATAAAARGARTRAMSRGLLQTTCSGFCRFRVPQPPRQRSVSWQTEAGYVTSAPRERERAVASLPPKQQRELDTAFRRVQAYHKDAHLVSTKDGGHGAPSSSAQQQDDRHIDDDTSDGREHACREWSWILEEVRRRVTSRELDKARFTSTVSDMVRRLTELDEPLAYIIGNQPFGPLTILCEPPTLIPRPETEFLAEHLASCLRRDVHRDGSIARSQLQGTTKKEVLSPPPPLRILDLCTGTGCIALLLRHHLLDALRDAPAASKGTLQPQASKVLRATVTAADISFAALALARSNARVNAAQHATSDDLARVPLSIEWVDMMDDASIATLRSGEREDASHGQLLFDIVVCNPPYIPAHDWVSLDRGVRAWEDRLALVGSDAAGASHTQLDGLHYYRRLASLLSRKRLLAPPSSSPRETPSLAVEVGKGQAGPVAAMFRRAAPPTATVETWRDPFGVDRAVFLWLAPDTSRADSR